MSTPPLSPRMGVQYLGAPDFIAAQSQAQVVAYSQRVRARSEAINSTLQARANIVFSLLRDQSAAWSENYAASFVVQQPHDAIRVLVFRRGEMHTLLIALFPQFKLAAGRILGWGSDGKARTVKVVRLPNQMAKECIIRQERVRVRVAGLNATVHTDFCLIEAAAFKVAYAVQELCPHGTLREAVYSGYFNEQVGGEILERQLPFLAYDLIQAVFCLHDKNIVHFNLNPDAILLRKQNQLGVRSFSLVLSGLRHAQQAKQHSLFRIPVNALEYLAPETFLQVDEAITISSKDITMKNDAWMLGRVLHFLLTKGLRDFYAMYPGAEGPDARFDRMTFAVCQLVEDGQQLLNAKLQRDLNFRYIPKSLRLAVIGLLQIDSRNRWTTLDAIEYVRRDLNRLTPIEEGNEVESD